MTVVSPKKHDDAKRVADISRKLMGNPEVAAMIRALGTSTPDANDLVRGLLQATINSGLEAEMDAHLGYEHSDREGKACSRTANSRNGSYPKTVDSDYGPAVRTSLAKAGDWFLQADSGKGNNGITPIEKGD